MSLLGSLPAWRLACTRPPAPAALLPPSPARLPGPPPGAPRPVGSSPSVGQLQARTTARSLPARLWRKPSRRRAFRAAWSCAWSLRVKGISETRGNCASSSVLSRPALAAATTSAPSVGSPLTSHLSPASFRSRRASDASAAARNSSDIGSLGSTSVPFSENFPCGS